MKFFIILSILLMPVLGLSEPDNSINPDKKQITGTAGSFTGRIISIQDSQLEVKKGSIEMTFQLSGEIKIEKAGAPLTQQDLKICQLITIEYIKTAETITVNKILIVQESYCAE